MEIGLHEFKLLLRALKDEDIAIKVKTLTGWSNDFLHIIGFISPVHDKPGHNIGGLVLSNQNETEGILINNIATIASFQLEKSCMQYDAGKIYDLVDNTALKAIIAS